MTRVGLISDVHANLPALDRVLDDMPSVDTLVCCGDIIGYGPYPKECVDRVREAADISLVGNHEMTLLQGNTYHSTTARRGIEFAKEQLYSEDYDWLSTLPKTTMADELQVVHSHPNPNNWGHVHEPDIERVFSEYFERDVFVYGHTHDPVNTVVNETLVVNPGSVGQPRDGDSRAAYAVVDTDTRDCTLSRVAYDIDRTVEKLEQENFSTEMADRLRDGT